MNKYFKVFSLAILLMIGNTHVGSANTFACNNNIKTLKRKLCGYTHRYSQAKSTSQSMTQKGTVYFKISSYQYSEKHIMSKTGTIPFVGVGYDRNFKLLNRNLHFNIESQYGITKYNGSGVTGPDQTIIIHTQLQRYWHKDNLVFSSGLGYRFLYDLWGDQTTSTGLPTYDRRSEYFFGSVGTKIKFTEGRSLFLEYKHLLQGKHTSYLNNATWSGRLRNKQPKGFGISALYRLNQRKILELDYWHISDSASDNQGLGFFEPANSTLQVGLRYIF